MTAAYHVCPSSAVPDILATGLHPRIGPRAQDLGEAVPAVYLFETPDGVETAMLNWLGDCFEEDLSVLEVDLPETLRRGAGADFEIVILDPIPADRIRVAADLPFAL
ncbi:hypothetical protein CKO28_00850 [Rhodovibrio sodomensis]|uniref:Uncharacterized protein n=1 Tax=Rhodovibrio sodomensis TaxID=1088 RepID=A0ABS1DAY9_9PROT|nr:hypothetical protein [Rhodovibrio sodomensis]MBK1666590.1 hypothetical protein [Rhodovibrio sodomensis]